MMKLDNITIGEFIQFLKDISTFIKNLIIYKGSESGKDRAHIRSVQLVLERRLNEIEQFSSFFNCKNKSFTMQLVNYLVRCGEIIKLQNGYYAVLPMRKVQLPMSKIVLEVGKLTADLSKIANMGLAVPIIQNDDSHITIIDYRYDLSIKEYIKLFETTQKDIRLVNEEYYKPFKHRFMKLLNKKDIKDSELYYVKSYPHTWDEVEHYIARKEKGHWKGEKVSSNLWKAKMSLLVNQGYQPTYKIESLNTVKNITDIFQITLSDQLPKAEEEQVYLFSLPSQLDYCKKYYVQQDYLRDFTHVLSNIGFIEESNKW